MTVLAALARYYERLSGDPESGVPPYGYSLQNVGWCLLIGSDGTPSQVLSMMDGEGKKARPRRIAVPQPSKRTSGIAANFLWDKSAYVLGVTAGNGKRTVAEHAAFKRLHRDVLTGTEDAGLRALLAFLDRWTPDQLSAPMFPDAMRDGNVVFRFADELGFLHDRPAAKAIWARINAGTATDKAICLVTGEVAPVARLHPSIKGVWGAQTAGASIVSFNLDAFTSYGHEHGDNAPISEAAAFAYTTALNRLLEAGSRHRVQIGDASTVFWAEADEPEQAELAEACFGAALGLDIDEEMQAEKVRPILQAISKGRSLADFDPGLAKGVKFHVLGLSPNAARLSVRVWLEDNFGAFADRLAEHGRDMEIDPPPREATPTIQRLLRETAVQHKYENVPPQLAGQLLRAVLAGGRYPAALLATLLMRLRADGEIGALRVAMLKAIVVRDRRLSRVAVNGTSKNSAREDRFVAYDPDCREPGYLLGQLFAVYEYAQVGALGRNVNATVKDKFYGSASTTPESVFPLLDRGSVPHIAKLRKLRRGQAIDIEKQIAEIMERLVPAPTTFPKSLPPAQQALFALGYYHQRNRRFAPKPEPAVEEEAA